MGIFTDVMQAVAGAAQSAFLGGASGGALMAAKRDEVSKADEARFFGRAFDSVARKARQSVLLFPVVVSDGVSAQTATMLGRALQARSAEYVRLAIANMDSAPLTAGSEKSALVASIRGATLKDALFGEGAELAETNAYLERNLAELAALAARPPARLAPGIGRLAEAEEEEEGGPPWDDYDEDRPRYVNDPPPPGRTGGRLDIPYTRQDWEDDQAYYGRRPGAGGGDGGKGGGGDGGGGGGKRGATGPGGQPAPWFSPWQAPGTAQPGAGAAGAAKPGTHSYSVQPNMDKLNAFAPVTLDLTFKYRPVLPDGSVGDEGTSQLLLAVKSQVHMVPAAEMAEALGRSLARDSMFLQFLRLTSGEISFVSDFVLGLSYARAAAAPGRSRALDALRRQADWNEKRRSWLVAAVTKRGFVPPTATVVITADDAQRIRQRFNVDFTRVGPARQLLRSHNLMGFAVVDEALQYARVFEDGDDDFDRVPFSELQERGKEASVKDIMSILAKR